MLCVTLQLHNNKLCESPISPLLSAEACKLALYLPLYLVIRFKLNQSAITNSKRLAPFSSTHNLDQLLVLNQEPDLSSNWRLSIGDVKHSLGKGLLNCLYLSVQRIARFRLVLNNFTRVLHYTKLLVKCSKSEYNCTCKIFMQCSICHQCKWDYKRIINKVDTQFM